MILKHPKHIKTCFYFIIINNTIDLFSIGGNMVKKGDFNLMICFDGGTFFCKFLLITGIKNISSFGKVLLYTKSYFSFDK